MNATGIETCPSCGTPRILCADDTQMGMTCDACPPEPSTTEAEQVKAREYRLAIRRTEAKATAQLTYGHDLHGWQLVEESRLRLRANCRRCGARVQVSGYRDETTTGAAIERHCHQDSLL